MAVIELHNAPTRGKDREGAQTATRSWLVQGATDQNFESIMNSAGIFLVPKVSPHPRVSGVRLDSFSGQQQGNDVIVTARYDSRSSEGGDLDPLDDFFGTWTIGFRNVKYPIPRIQAAEAVLSLADDTTQSTVYWNVADDFEVTAQEVIFTWQGNDDGLSDGSVSLSLAAAATVWGQAGKLHRLPLGGLWRFEPRQVRQAVKGKFLVDYSWVLESDLPYVDDTGTPITNFPEAQQGAVATENPGKWALTSTYSAVPLFPNPNGEGFLLRPAYSTIIVTPNRDIEPSLANAPTLRSLRTYGIGGENGNGWQLLPGLF